MAKYNNTLLKFILFFIKVMLFLPVVYNYFFSKKNNNALLVRTAHL